MTSLNISTSSFKPFLIASYINVSIIAVLAYDYVLTFEQEISLVWDSSWSLVKILFVVVRYPPFVTSSLILYASLFSTISESTCHGLISLSACMILLGACASDAILLIRTWALWNRDKRIAIILGAISVGAVACMIVVCTLWQKTIIFPLNEARNSRCPPVDEGKLLVMMIGVFVFVSMSMLILTVMRMLKFSNLSQQRGFRNRLVHVFYRDGMAFFIQMLFISIGNIIMIATASLTSVDKDMLIFLQHIIHSILSARVLFNLRETQRRGDTKLSMSDVMFVSPSRTDSGVA